MSSLYNICKQTTLTGATILLLGLVTLIPEIYFSGIIVMLISASLHITDLETHRKETLMQTNDSIPSEPLRYGDW